MSPKLTIDIITLFPKMMEGFIQESILGRAIRHGVIEVNLVDLREWGEGPRKTVDDRPFGGGAGMIIKPEPLYEAILSLKMEATKVIYLSPEGKKFNSAIAQNFAQEHHLILVSGHYEGIDDRVRQTLIDEEISIGDYILTNGTLAATVFSDAVLRYVPGVLGEEKSLTQDSFNDSLLSFPQYTRPANFRGMNVPEVLLSGDHKAIEQWRENQKIKRTHERRPDLINN